MKKILTIVGVIALLLVLLIASVGVWAYYEFLYTHPLDEQELAELKIDWDNATGGNWSPWWDRGDGTIEWNPSASYNEWMLSIPDEEKAWPIMATEFVNHEYGLLAYEHMGALPTDPERWELVVDHLESDDADALLSQLLIAFERPYLGVVWSKNFGPEEHAAFSALAERDSNAWDPGVLRFDPTENVAMIDMMMPWLGWHRKHSHFVVSKAAYELEDGNTDEFVEAMTSLMKSSDFCRTIPTYIGLLVEFSIENSVITTIDWALTNHRDQFTENHLAEFEQVLAAHAGDEFVWGGEMLQVVDIVRRMSTEDGRLSPAAMRRAGGQGLVLQSPTHVPATEMGATAQRMMLVNRRMFGAASRGAVLPWESQDDAIAEIYDEQVAEMNSVAEVLLEVLMPAIGRASSRACEHAQIVVGFRLGVAAERHALRHGSFPVSIEEIDSDLITFNPIDAFTGSELKYEIFDGTPYIYSVGPDRIDNDGFILWEEWGADEYAYLRKAPIEWVTPSEAKVVFLNPEDQGDWVLYPVPPDEPEPLDVPDDFDPDWDLKQDGMYNEESGAETIPEDD